MVNCLEQFKSEIKKRKNKKIKSKKLRKKNQMFTNGIYKKSKLDHLPRVV